MSWGDSSSDLIIFEIVVKVSGVYSAVSWKKSKIVASLQRY
jgi:hypothetical protein